VDVTEGLGSRVRTLELVSDGENEIVVPGEPLGARAGVTVAKSVRRKEKFGERAALKERVGRGVEAGNVTNGKQYPGSNETLSDDRTPHIDELQVTFPVVDNPGWSNTHRTNDIIRPLEVSRPKNMSNVLEWKAQSWN
jgi:hypothetical protein